MRILITGASGVEAIYHFAAYERARREWPARAAV